MLLQVHHIGLSDGNPNKPNYGVGIEIKLWGSAACTMQEVVKTNKNRLYLNHVPFLKLIKNLQSFYSASSAQVSVSNFTDVCRQDAKS